METKKEVIKTLNNLKSDYSDLISECEKYIRVPDFDPPPQPSTFMKSFNKNDDDDDDDYDDDDDDYDDDDDSKEFFAEDCEKIIDGNYTIDGKNLGGAKDNCINLTYKKTAKKKIDKPYKKEPKKPIEPTYEKVKINHPISRLLTIVTTVMGIISYIYFENPTNNDIYGLMMFFAIIGGGGTLFLFLLSMGGFIGLFVNIYMSMSAKKEYKQKMEEYNRELYLYKIETKAAEVEYENAMKDYERQLEEVDKEYERKNNKKYNQILADIEKYIITCKEYFKKKEAFDKERQKKLDAIDKDYKVIHKRLGSYPDFIPTKFFKVLDSPGTYSRFILGGLYGEVTAYIQILESGRADTFKEAVNCYFADKDEEKKRRILKEQGEEAREREERRIRILKEQAEEQRRYNEEQAEEQRRYNEEQAEEQRRQADEQRRFNERQAEEQRRRADEQRRFNERQAKEQQKAAQMQACASSTCVTCRRKCGMAFYSPMGYAGCIHYTR